MIAPISPPTTTLSEVIYVLAISVPASLILHATLGMAMRRKVQSSDPSAAARIRKFYWSVPSLILAWLPFLIMSLGNVGCSLLRDAGYQIFPWPLLSVSLLFGIAMGACNFLRERMIKKLAPETRNT